MKQDPLFFASLAFTLGMTVTAITSAIGGNYLFVKIAGGMAIGGAFSMAGREILSRDPVVFPKLRKAFSRLFEPQGGPR